MQSSVKIKGISEGLLITLGQGEWKNLSKDLYQEIDNQLDFLNGAKIILDVENHVIGASAMGKLRDILSDKGLSLWAILSHSPTTEKNAQALGLATRIHQTHPDEDKQEIISEVTGDEGILIRKTLRSGNSIQHPGHVTVIGDVNPGSEIIAGGDIVVWGKLSGMVHAGANGDNSAIICALKLSPTQLRIATQISVSPKNESGDYPEMVSIQNDMIIAQAWE